MISMTRLVDGCRNSHEQLSLALSREELGHGLTFRDSRKEPVHRWYPYVEGFSAGYVRELLLSAPSPRKVFDPFGGSGTAQLEAAKAGIPSYYCEINPFMAFVSETKVSAAAWARANWAEFESAAQEFRHGLTQAALADGSDPGLDSIDEAFPARAYFEVNHLRDLLAARYLAKATSQPAARDLFLLACASVAVECSNMTRRADLRRRRPDEYKGRVVDVASSVRRQLDLMLEDIPTLPERLAPMVRASSDAKDIPQEYDDSFDVAVTSPPYLNGTNYFRNTKIELWLMGYIQTEDDLAPLRRLAVAAGINNVTKSRDEPKMFADVEAVAERLDQTDGDGRIPSLVRHYFSDMALVLSSVARVLAPGGRFHLDIGDSKYYGVHVPTPDLLAQVARGIGFSVDEPRILARRHSRDKSPLVQVELVLTKRSRVTRAKHRNLPAEIERFGRALPYRNPTYSTRAWGHPLHSLCSYQGKMKPGLAHWLIKTFVPSRGLVLDPLGGVGTIALEAALAGHRSFSNDLSPFPALVAAAKLDPPTLGEVEIALDRLVEQLRGVDLTTEDFEASEFGLNGAVADYFHPATLREVLSARRLLQERPPGSRGERFMWASLLHVLHGNRPYALSRTSHPITPFHPSGPFEYRSLVAAIRAKAARTLATPLPASFVPGTGLEGDFRDLPTRKLPKVDAIITSPPFLGMRFDRPNWLRLWFMGWDESAFHERSRAFLERQQAVSTEVYQELFDVCRTLMRDDGLLVIHMGSGDRGDLLGDIRRLAVPAFRLAGEVAENVEDLEQHGVRDKGRTKAHHVLVFTRS